ISQHTTPICKGGYLEIVVGEETRRVRLNRIHIEEDAGKSLHDENSPYTNIDYNRAGMPLLEIVTEPDIRSAEEAFAYVTALRKLVRHLDVCDGNMEQGSLRSDVNISVRKKGDEKLGTKVEIKNLNSIRFIKKAIENESRRLIDLHRKGEKILQQTRGLNEDDFTTYAIRTKEDEDDYRYFPEPDLPPFFITDEMIEAVRLQMPASPEEIKNELIQKYQLKEYDALQLADDADLAQYFKAITSETHNYKAAANWTLGPVKNHLSTHELSLEEFKVNPSSIAWLIHLIDEGKINFGTATQKIFPELIATPSLDIETFIEEKELKLETSESQIDLLIQAALEKHAQKITEYKKGKKGLISLFVGEVMKLSKGNADARLVTEKIIEKLKA
ncbi:MAG TPA: Asp-tRNA(Asn)/Glu-tRNA(Gln) amidotransferase subunit GatB, partial [Flavisolibacter sp.]|nr:Asp-tRNA(Asn)/Glu-tRNA(Gln) amidotransferase subunit GatB [Flavisolibacter sp.]